MLNTLFFAITVLNPISQFLDSSFSSWQLYKCGKTGESPYLVTRVYQMIDDGFPEPQELDDYYSNPRNILFLPLKLNLAKA